MSEMADALTRKMIEAGVIEQGPSMPVILEVSDEEAQRPDLAWVQLPGEGRINSEFNEEIGRLCAGKGLYRHKGRIVIVGLNPKTRRVEIEEMEAHGFRTWVEKRAQLVCYKLQFGKHGAFKVRTTMGVDMAMTCLKSTEFRDQQPILLRVNLVRLPVQRANGRIELLPDGYDEESGILTFAPAWEYDESMTLTEAVHILDDMDSEFPFQDARSRAVFRAAMVSQFGYHLQPLDSKRLNFLFHATGNGSGTGKTLLVEIALTIPWMYASVDSMPEDTGKMRDRLDTAVRDAKPYVLFDDLDQSYLKSGMLNGFMTATWWSGRKFHAQEEFMEPKAPVVFLTANGLDISPDIARRVLTCDLFTAEADLQSRPAPRREIDAEWIRSAPVHRQLCSALWTAIKAWRDSDRKYEGRLIRGYESWCRIFSAICMRAGFGDPSGPRESDSYGNSEFADMTELVSAMAEGVETKAEMDFSEVLNLCRARNCFEHIIKGKIVKAKSAQESDEFIASDECNSKMGRQLGRYGGKTFVTKDGRRVMFDKRGKNRHRRYLIQVIANAPK